MTAHDAVNFTWQGVSYTIPEHDAVNFTWQAMGQTVSAGHFTLTATPAATPWLARVQAGPFVLDATPQVSGYHLWIYRQAGHFNLDADLPLGAAFVGIVSQSGHFKLSAEINCATPVIIPPVQVVCGHFKINGIAAGEVWLARLQAGHFLMAAALDDSTLHYYEFHTISGAVVDHNNNPLNRIVRLYAGDTGQLLQQVNSVDGMYEFELDYRGEYNIVCIAQDPAVEINMIHRVDT